MVAPDFRAFCFYSWGTCGIMSREPSEEDTKISEELLQRKDGKLSIVN